MNSLTTRTVPYYRLVFKKQVNLLTDLKSTFFKNILKSRNLLWFLSQMT